MELSEYVGELRRELATITRFASEDITRAAEMLTEALDSSVRLTLLDVLSAAAADIADRHQVNIALVECRLHRFELVRPDDRHDHLHALSSLGSVFHVCPQRCSGTFVEPFRR